MSNISTLKREVKRIQTNIEKVKQSEIKHEPFMLPFLTVQIIYQEYEIEQPDGSNKTINRYKYKLGFYGSDTEPDLVKLFDKMIEARKKGQSIFVLYCPPKKENLDKLRLKYDRDNSLKIVFKDKLGREEVFYFNPNGAFGNNKPNQTKQDKYIEDLV
ncbi:MAG: hypothetical protein ACE364_09335 [Chlorobiota bacterium]